jgi:UPF0755 protein
MRRLGCLPLILIAAGLVFAAMWFNGSWRGEGPLKESTTFSVPDGSSLTGTANRLEKAGAIRSSTAFRIGAKLFGGAAVIKAGDYRIPAHASASQILAILQGGKTVPLLVAIPEGMPSILVQERLMANKDLTGPVSVPEEGSVLPDSYGYEKGESRASVLARMQAAMSQFMAEQWPKRDATTPVKTQNEALALASIVEKETAIASERATVAGVYANRVRQGIMLQADPTIIYPITKGKPLGRRILLSEKRARNGYNTYAMAGLPKGPIANPGRAAIIATLHPAQTNALYFVADGKGGHVFANTLAEHDANVRKWYAIRRARGEM